MKKSHSDDPPTIAPENCSPAPETDALVEDYFADAIQRLEGAARVVDATAEDEKFPDIQAKRTNEARRLREAARRLRSTGADASAVMFILERDGRILMERCPKKGANFDTAWFVPGGRIEPGESDGETLVREMKEELGCKPTRVRWCGYVDRTAEGWPLFLMHVAHVEEWEGEIPEVTKDHGDPLRWMPTPEVARSPVSGIRAAVAVALPPEHEECAACEEPTPERFFFSSEIGPVCAVCSHEALMSRLELSHKTLCEMLDPAGDEVCTCRDDEAASEHDV